MSNTVNEYIEQHTQTQIEQWMQEEQKTTKRKKLIYLTKLIASTKDFVQELEQMQKKQKKHKRTAQYIFMYLGSLYTPEAMRTERKNIALFEKMYLQIKTEK